MIKSFNQFLLSLNESILNYLPNFSGILKMMSSPIAKDLLDLRGSDLKITTNFISSGDDDFVSFIPDSKSDDVKTLAEITGLDGFITNVPVYEIYGLNKATPKIGDKIYFIGPLDDSFKKVNQYWYMTTPLHYKTLSGEDLILDEPYKKVSTKEISEVITKAKAQQMKVGRLAKKLLSLVDKKYKDSDIENFVNEFKSKIELSKNAFRNFSLVSGDEIKEWYHYSKYYEETKGSLHSSCMRYDECQEYFDIYTENPDVCKLLICKSDFDNTKITGRALVWKLNTGETFVDRVYYSNQHDIDLFNEYAKSMGWIYKNKNSRIMLGESQHITSSLIVKLTEYDCEKYPYLDTLMYLSEDGLLTSNGSGNEDKELTSTDGSYSNGCEYCNGEGTVECNDCEGDGAVECGTCDGNGSTDCEVCDGNGDIECDECEGSGKNPENEDEDCSSCDGNGENKCKECDGGSIDCEDCDGGNVECSSCEGTGTVDCYECS